MSEITKEDLDGLPDVVLQQLDKDLIKELLGRKEFIRLFYADAEYKSLLAEVANKPLTFEDAAGILNIDDRPAAALLNNLYEAGLIQREKMIKLSRNRNAWLYKADFQSNDL